MRNKKILIVILACLPLMSITPSQPKPQLYDVDAEIEQIKEINGKIDSIIQKNPKNK